MPKKVSESMNIDPANIPTTVTIDVESFHLSKGLTLSLEALGGNKFEMARLDAGITIKGKPTVQAEKEANAFMDAYLNQQLADLHSQYKGG